MFLIAPMPLIPIKNSHIVFNGIALRHAATANLVIDADDVSVQGCDISGAGWHAQIEQANTGDGILLVNGATKTNLLSNSIHGNLRHGVYNSGTSNRSNTSTLENNLIYGNGGSGFISDTCKASSLLRNFIDSNQYGIYLGDTTGYSLKSNRVSRNAALELYAPAGASLKHANNNFWRASSFENTVIYGGSSYSTANLNDFEETALVSNPVSDLEVTINRHIGFSYYTGNVLWCGDYSGNILSSTDDGQNLGFMQNFQEWCSSWGSVCRFTRICLYFIGRRARPRNMAIK